MFCTSIKHDSILHVPDMCTVWYAWRIRR